MKHKQHRKFVALVMVVMFILSTVVPSLAADPWGVDGIMDISEIGGGNGGGQLPSLTIYFGNYWQSATSTAANKEPIKWLVLENSQQNKRVFLLSDKALYADSFDDDNEYYANVWGVSPARSTLSGLPLVTYGGKSLGSDKKTYKELYEASFARDALSEAEYNAIAHTTHTAGGSGKHSDLESTDKLFLLSREEAMNTDYGFSNSELWIDSTRLAKATDFAKNVKMYMYGNDKTAKCVGGNAYWWLRSAYNFLYFERAYEVDDAGIISHLHYVDNDDFSIRPAMKLSYDSVLFLSAAEATKSDGSNYDKNSKSQVNVGDGFALGVYDGSNGWKVTVKDTSIKAPTISNISDHDGHYDVNEHLSGTVLTVDGDEQDGDPYLTLNYSGLDLNKADYVSAVVCDKDGHLVNYAKVGNTANGETGVKVRTDDLALGTYTVKFFAEKANGNYLTDYASEFVSPYIFEKVQPGDVITTLSSITTATQAILTNNAVLGFEATAYNTDITIGDNETTGHKVETGIIKAAVGSTTGSTTLTGNLEIGKDSVLITEGSFRLQGTNTINGNLYIGTSSKVVVAGGITTFGDNASTMLSGENPLIVDGGTLELNAVNYWNGTKGKVHVDFQSGTLHFTGGELKLADEQTLGNKDTIIAAGNTIINSKITNYEPAANADRTVSFTESSTFGENGVIKGGNVGLHDGMEFTAANLSGAPIGETAGNGISKLALPNADDEAATYNFRVNLNDDDPLVDKIIITGNGSSGNLKIRCTDIDGKSAESWSAGQSKTIAYIVDSSSSSTSPNNTIQIDGSYEVVYADPGKDNPMMYIFKQAIDGDTPIYGSMSITMENGATLAQIVQNDEIELPDDSTWYAGNVEEFHLNSDYEATERLGTFDESGALVAGKPRTLTIQSDDGDAFKGNDKSGITLRSATEVGIGAIRGDTLNMVNIGEISGWKANSTSIRKIAFVNAGKLNFYNNDEYAGALTLYDGIFNNVGGIVTFDQDTILDFAGDDTTGTLSGDGLYINNATMTVKDAAKLAMTGLTNTKGIVNLEGGELGAKITGGAINIGKLEGSAWQSVAVSSLAGYIAGDTNEVKENATLTLTGDEGDQTASTLVKEITGGGKVIVSDYAILDNKVSTDILEFGGPSTGSVVTDASYIAAEKNMVANGAILTVKGGVLSKDLINGDTSNENETADYYGGYITFYGGESADDATIIAAKLNTTGLAGSIPSSSKVTFTDGYTRIEEGGVLDGSNFTNKSNAVLIVDDVSRLGRKLTNNGKLILGDGEIKTIITKNADHKKLTNVAEESKVASAVPVSGEGNAAAEDYGAETVICGFVEVGTGSIIQNVITVEETGMLVTRADKLGEKSMLGKPGFEVKLQNNGIVEFTNADAEFTGDYESKYITIFDGKTTFVKTPILTDSNIFFNISGSEKKNGYKFVTIGAKTNPELLKPAKLAVTAGLETLPVQPAADPVEPADPVDLSGVEVTILQTEAVNKLAKGDSMTLIDKVKTGSYGGSTAVWARSDNGLTNYLYGVSIAPQGEYDSLIFGLFDEEVADETKSFSEARLGMSAALNGAADLVATSVIDSANTKTANWESFVTLGGSHSRYETGSHVDLNMFNVAAGLSKVVFDNLTLGIFAEGGSGRYSTENNFAEGLVTSDGNINYFGGGIFAKIEGKKTDLGFLHGEASFRAGYINSKYDSDNFNPGTNTSFNLGTPYLGAHAGFGYKWALAKNGASNIDTYMKYFWSRQGSDSTSIDGENLDFDAINSHRVRLGARYNGKSDKNGFNFFGGLAYEYEFDGKAKGHIADYAMLEPDFKGGSGMAELGFRFEKEESPWRGELAVQGFTGKRDSIGANLSIWYMFGK